MSQPKNDDNNFDDLFTTNEDSNVDDLFSTDSNSDSQSDGGLDFDSLSGISGVEDISSGFDLSGMSQVEVGGHSSEFDFSGITGLEGAAAGTGASEEASNAGKGKKGKKGKKDKRVKAVPKTKEKPVDDGVRYGSAKPFVVLGALFLLLIVAGDLAALMTAGAGSIMFLVYFNILGVALLAVPYCLIRQLRTRSVSLFDMALAVAAAAVVVGCMAILAYQAKTYGGSTKATASAIPAVVKTLDRC